jgi:hypothetical protein
VHNRESASPLEGAFVSLLDTAGTIAGGVSTDRSGRFVLVAPEPGVFAVMARSLGYQREISGWLRLGSADTLEVTFRLERIAITLSPIVVSAQRDSLLELRAWGIPIRSLAGTLVTEAEVMHAAAGTTRMTETVQNLRLPSVYLKHFVVSKGDARVEGPRSCLALTRTSGCITVVIDGLRLTTADQLYQLDEVMRPELVKGMVFLRPAEAGVLFGGESANGVLLILTKTGAR